MNKHQSILELLRKAEQDASLREALQSTTTPEDVVQIAAGAGVTITVEEIEAFHENLQTLQQQAADGELSEAELEKTAGGLEPITMGVLFGGFIAAGVGGAVLSGAAIGGVGGAALGGLGVHIAHSLSRS